ncbi:hypothetical protein QUF90_01965 [Desulfococcaceae bacterium HSG9]|nr:hypothetical protein [Desulfococcaceae bacterium HSG9]
MKKASIGFTLVFCILLTSCGLRKMMIGPTFQPVDTILQGHGLVYLYRPWNFFGMAVPAEIKVDETKVTTLCNETYYPLFQPVGEVTFWAKGEFKSSVTLNIEEGEEYYVYMYILPGLLYAANPRLKIVTNEVGKKDIVKCKLGCPKWPEVQKEELDKKNEKNDNSTKNTEKSKIAAVVKVKEIGSDTPSGLEKDKEPIDKSDQIDNTASNNPLKVAILTWKPKTSTYFPIVLDIIVKTIKRNPNFILTDSYYKLHQQPTVKQINTKLVQKKLLGELWEKKNYWSAWVPDIAKAVEIGQILKVDRVIMGEYKISTQGWGSIMDYIKIHMIDVHAHSVQTYRSKSHTILTQGGDYGPISKVVTEAIRISN